MRTNRLRSIFVRIVFVAAALVLLAAPAADAKRTTSLGLKKLTLATGGPEDYLFTAGNTVAGQATLDPTALASRFQVFDPNGNPIVTTPCTLPNRKRTAAGTYTIQPADPTSTGTAWKFQLQQFGNTGCTGNGYSTADLYFDVAKATSFAPGSPPSTQKSIFPAGGSAYVRVAGVGAVKSTSANTLTPLWSTSWVLPSGGTACANTGVNRPSASATGSFPLTSVAPGNAQSFLEYAPNGYNGDGFNQPASYTSACPAFAAGNQGQWQVKLQKDATHFVTLPAFTVDTTAPDTTITSAPSGTQNTNTASFQFTSTDALATFQCAQVDPGGGAPVYSSCTSPKNYNGLPQGSHTFYVRSVDQAGNVDASSASVTWSVDTVGPAVTLTAPAAAAQLNDPTPVLSGAAGNVGGISPDSTTVTVEIYQGTMPGLGSPYRSFTVTRAGAAWSVQHTTWTTQSQSALPDGTYVAVAKQKDAVNNEASSDSHVFFVDTQAPTVTVLHPSGGQSAGTGTPNMDGTAGTASTDASSVTVEIFSGTTAGGAPARSFTPPVTGGVWAVDSGVWDSTTPLPEGTWTVRASQADAAGNTGTSFARTFTVDTTAPTTTITSGPGSPTSDTAASFGFTSNETGATFQCAIDGGVTPTLTACASPKAYSGLLPGVHTFQVQAVDAAGNVDATPATWTWTIDTTVPAVTIGSPADGLVTSDSTPAIGGTAGTATGDTSTVTVKVATAAAPGTAVRTLTTTADSSGAWSLTVVPALPDGIYLYHAEQSDSVPLTGFSATRTLTVDTTPPTTTITQAPTSPTAATQATLRFSSNKAGSTFQCRRDGAAYANCTSPVTYTGLGQGAHTFDVRATDTAGNVDNVGATATWTVNSALPNVSLATPADGLVTNNRSVSFSGTAGTNVAGGDATTLTVKIYRLVSGGAPQFVQSQANVTINSSNGSWSTAAFPVLDDGGYVAHAEQANTVTGTGSSADRTFTVDATPPDTTVSGGPPGLTSSTSATFQPGSSEASSTYECNLDGGAWIACSNPINVVTLLNSGSPLSDGQHTLLVRATDAAGNTDPTPAQRVWTVDSTAPTPVLNGPSGLINDPNPTFTGTTDDQTVDVVVEIYLASDPSTPVDTLPAVTPNATTGAWSQNEDNALDDGSYVAYAEQTDSAGNPTAYSDPQAFTVDTTPPSVTLAAPPTLASGTPVLSGQAGSAAGDGSSVTVRIYAGATPTGSPVRTFSVPRSGSSWSGSPSTPLGDGQYTAQAEQTDDAGNTGASDPHTFSVDGTAPSTTITSGPSGTTTANDASFAFSANDAGATFECKVDSGSFAACTSPKSYSGLAAGSHTFQVRAADDVGNVGTAVSRTWTISAPTAAPTGQAPTTDPATTPATAPVDQPVATPAPRAPAAIKLTVTASKKQRLKTRRLIVTAKCDALCTIKLAPIAKLPKTTKLSALTKKLPAGKKVRVALKLSKKQLAKLVAALKAHKKGLTVQLTATAAPTSAARSASKPITLKIKLMP